jgi:hypothetical protein
MDKRLQKRHKRQVARAKENIKVSEPDLRTPEQIKAAREASRPSNVDSGSVGLPSSQAPRSGRPQSSGSAAKTGI